LNGGSALKQNPADAGFLLGAKKMKLPLSEFFRGDKGTLEAKQGWGEGPQQFGPLVRHPTDLGCVV
jgi:hypothetical protein